MVKTSERSRVIDFLERNVIGRTVVAEPITTYTNQGRTESTYIDQTFFSGLVHTADGFRFDLTTVSLGRRYGLDDEGRHQENAGVLDAVRVYRYEMTERASSGRLVGFARFISSTNTASDPFSGTFFLVRMRMEGDELVIQDTQVGYADFFDYGGTRKPVASDGLYRYTAQDGKVVLRFTQSTFDVDPNTMDRTPTGDRFPTQISEERA
ncbi:hypothetical protein ACFOY2_06910 [Nonomuraea purpurea]|uniref:Uncharacterized protein n=1 Tax=Nonomuraea purpurea TaxID=1849276 RepID=A0ABV8FZS6_9ACTN